MIVIVIVNGNENVNNEIERIFKKEQTRLIYE